MIINNKSSVKIFIKNQQDKIIIKIIYKDYINNFNSIINLFYLLSHVTWDEIRKNCFNKYLF